MKNDTKSWKLPQNIIKYQQFWQITITLSVMLKQMQVSGEKLIGIDEFINKVSIYDRKGYEF